MIEATSVRLIDSEKQNHGIVPFQDAMKMADEAGMDLVEVSNDSDPPVCRIMNFSKYKYEKKKREKAAKHTSKSKQVKEIRLTPKIGDHDLKIKVAHAIQFMDDGHRVQFTLRFKGREQHHVEVGRAVLDHVIELTAGVAKVEVSPHKQGRRMFMLLVSIPLDQRGKKKDASSNEQESPEVATDI